MPNLTEILIAIVAVYGAALSTYMLVRRIQSEKPKVLVAHGWTYALGEKGMDKTPTSLDIQAVNHGARDVVVQSLCLEIPDLCRITPKFLASMSGDSSPNNKYPVSNTRLKCGDQTDISFDYDALSMMLTERGYGAELKIRAVCEDTLENVYIGEWFKMDKDSRGL